VDAASGRPTIGGTSDTSPHSFRMPRRPPRNQVRRSQTAATGWSHVRRRSSAAPPRRRPH